jgi:tetratricopeptide (TPR) repeat protein
MLLQRIVGAHPGSGEARELLRKLDPSQAPAVGRNDPCPCGSGRRYKECHGRLGQPPGPAAPPAGTSVRGLLEKGLALHRQGQVGAAEAAYREVLQVDSTNAIARHYLGVIAYQQQRFPEARELLEAALAGNEGIPDFHNNLGLVLHQQGELPLAIASFRRAAELNPGHVEAYNNLGRALQDEHRYQEALESFDAALATRPDFAEAHWNRALLYLLLGDFERGWKEYEWRLKHPLLGLPYERNFSEPRWDGSDPAGKTLLVYTEQGFGDALQFIRYTRELARRGALVLVDTAPPLRRLFAALPGVQVLEQGIAGVAFDFQVPLLSLPLLCRTTLSSIPREVPYLHAAADEVATWRRRLADDRALRVGLVWAGSAKNLAARHRNCPPEHFDALGRASGVSFYSLQKERTGPAPALALRDHTTEFADFAATAALVMNLDLVITIDSAVAHLAGALGRPAWVLLPYEREWRWLESGETTPWYPDMRLFHQAARGDWEGLFGRVAAELQSLSRARTQ